ncbi:MAG: hypothetical protein KBG07_02415 [Elusimicrobia bacterium]|nr:hypothetical protein [Elusimicrobiota bacterium]MBP9127606.1 hypothetical protein [Elusimicrobiota bacterium]
MKFLWRQWSALGLMGTAGVEDEWIIDPEALFVFSVGMARYEPRLFDEILGWLPTNGEWLDTARLKRMLPKDERSLRVFGGTIQWAQKMADERKWQGLARICGDIYKNQPIADSVEVLFKEQNGTDYPLSGNNVDPSFAAYFIDRPLANPRIAMSVPMTASTNLRFLLRALLGVGSRSECIAFLLTHEAGQVHQIAGEIGFFWLSVSQTLADLTRSGLVLTRSHGKRVEYWLSQRKWWVFLTHQDADQFKPPKWVNWSAIFPALVIVWETVDSLSKEQPSEYFTASRLQQALEVLHREFSRAGVDVPPLPSMALPPDMYQKTMATFVLRLLSGKSTVKA